MNDDSPKLNIKVLTLFQKRLWPYLRKYRGIFLLSLLLVLCSTGAALLSPWLLGHIVDHVLVPKRLDLVIPFAGLLFLTTLVRASTSVAQSYAFMALGQKTLHDLRQDLLKQYQFYPTAEFNRTPAGKLVTRLVNDTASLQDLFTSGLALALGNISVVIGIIVWLVVLNPVLGLVCVSIFPVMIFASRFFGNRIRETFRDSRTALSRLNAFLAENISGMWLIQIFNKQVVFRDRFDESSSDYTDKMIATLESYAYFNPIITILSSISMSLLIWYGGFRALEGTVTLGLLVAFVSYLQAMYAPIRDITEKYNLFLSAMASCERIFEFMDMPLEKGTHSKVEVVERASLEGHVELKNVSFRYEEPWVLKNVSFKAKPGERIGIVGHTGAGKTTLSALLLRLYDIEKGEILIDDKDVKSFDKRALRQALGHIQQEPFLFSGTVEENIFLWNEEGRSVFAALPDFARAPFETGTLPLSKTIFEKGANLSAGERQIIAFVRALVQNPSILILDEATAHVDPLTEQWIDRVSQESFKGRTVFIIAHRLATLKTVDRILVLHQGELVEEGTHRELLAKMGLYQKLYRIQSRREELEGESIVCPPPS